MPLFESLYAAGMSTARWLTPLLVGSSSKIGRGVRGRGQVLASMASWAHAARKPDAPLVWFHAPSVGEGLQTQAVIEALRLGGPFRGEGAQTVFTFFSPSAEDLARRMPVDWAGYLPWDVEADVSAALDSLRPDLIVFTKTEVWPLLSRLAAERGVATALIAATLPASSSRLRFPTRPVIGPSMGRLSLVAAISDDDASRFVQLGTPPSAVQVTGDPGIDSAVARASGADRSSAHLSIFHSPLRPLLVAGSTWEADERVLMPALREVRATRPDLQVVIAPHEPSEEHLARLTTAARELGCATATLETVEGLGRAADVDVVLVERVGVLAQLYTVADMAFVGGGFHGAGLHSVLEPAAAGIPTAFGPRHDNARAAGALLDVAGAVEVETAGDLARVLLGWVEDPDSRDTAGQAAREWLRGHEGAAARTAAAVRALL